MPANPRFLILILLLGVAGCAGVEPRKPQPTPTGPSAELISSKAAIALRQAKALHDKGEYLEAARLYNRLSTESIAPLKQHFKLEAAKNLLLAQQYVQTAISLETIDLAALDTEHYNDYTLLQIKLALAERDPEASKLWLQQMIVSDSTPLAQQIDFLNALIRTYELAGESESAVRERVNLDALLAPGKDKDANQQRILHTLLLQTSDKLVMMQANARSKILLGWIELSLLTQQNQDPLRLAGVINNWRQQNPSHPATDAAIGSIAPLDGQDSSPFAMDQIALLLPLQGTFSKLATAVQNGFLSAYYASGDERKRPKIRVYDTAADPEKIQSVYQQAIADGARLVVGPLNKQALESLVKNNRLSVPTLALNQLNESDFFAENLFQFALSPEDEARQVAERAWLDGHNRSAVLHPDGNWGERVAQAFAERWQELGGTIINTTAYTADKADFSTPIKKLLNLDKSLKRKRELAKLLRQAVISEPRRRQDIDMVFMAAFPRQARLIPPQLKFHHAGNLPVYTTSHSFSGTIDSRADRDMNGVIIGDMPWNLSYRQPSALHKTVFATWPKSARQLSRLYALGADAFNVLYYLNWLRANPNAHLTGMTGNLHMNARNQLQRTLSWARFESGRPRLLSTMPSL